MTHYGQMSDIPNPPGYGLLGPQVPRWLVELCGAPSWLEPSRAGPPMPQAPWNGAGITAQHAQQTQCCHGHPFDAANTRWKPGRYGLERRCRACHNALARALVSRQRHREEEQPC
jgi:hypothetical protein